jgi:hypothetical protein
LDFLIRQHLVDEVGASDRARIGQGITQYLKAAARR